MVCCRGIGQNGIRRRSVRDFIFAERVHDIDHVRERLSGVGVQLVELVHKCENAAQLLSELRLFILSETQPRELGPAAGAPREVHVQPGAEVTAETVLLEMTNPDVQLEALEATGVRTRRPIDLVARIT